MSIPFAERPARRDHETRFGSGSFELLCGPLLQSALHRGFFVIAAEKLKQSVAMMRQIRMQSRPAAIAAAVKPGDLIVVIIKVLAVDAQVTLAAEFDRRATHFDGHALAASGAQPPEFGRGKRRSTDRGLCCRSDCK
jgi:hypothetical protein